MLVIFVSLVPETGGMPVAPNAGAVTAELNHPVGWCTDGKGMRENARPHSPASSVLPLFHRISRYSNVTLELSNHVPECVGGAEKGCALHCVPDVILRVVRSGGGAGASLAVRHSSNAHCRRLARHVEDHCGLRAAQALQRACKLVSGNAPRVSRSACAGPAPPFPSTPARSSSPPRLPQAHLTWIRQPGLIRLASGLHAHDGSVTLFSFCSV